jgi:hypothetical protein
MGGVLRGMGSVLRGIFGRQGVRIGRLARFTSGADWTSLSGEAVDSLETCSSPEALFACSVGNLSKGEPELIGDRLDRCPASAS